MKKILIVTVLFLFFQEGFSQIVKYGVGAGANYSNLTSNKEYFNACSPRIGYHFYTFFEDSFNERFAIRFEPGFVKRVSKEKYNKVSNTVLNYITMPILLNYSLFDNFSLHVGSETSYRLKKNSSSEIYNDGANEKSNNKRIDIGLNAGIAYQLTNKINLNLRYNLNFISSLKNEYQYIDSQGVELESPNITNQGISLLLAYRIR